LGAVDLLGADVGDIVADGLALDQIVELYNFWKTLTTAHGQAVAQARFVLANSDTPIDRVIVDKAGPLGATTLRTIELFTDSATTGLGYTNFNPQKLSVVGHSLGGHLAMAFTRLFPGTASGAYAFNGAGFQILMPNVDRLFSMLGGASAFDQNAITSFYGSAGANFISQNVTLGLSQPGNTSEIFTESVSLGTTLGHGMGQLSDSAAVYDLFIRTDDRFKTLSASRLSASLLGLFKAADAEAGFTLEALVNDFGKLFVPGYAPISRLAAADRDGLHSRIIAIRDLLSAGNGGMSVLSLEGKSADQLANLAPTDIAYRYALRELNPFAVKGADYGSRNVDNSLEPYDASTDQGLTDQWVEARARFLQAMIAFNTVDGALNANAIGAHFEDRAKGIAFGPIDNTTARIIFGRDDQALMVGGSAADDSLFGAAGADDLSGGAGDDHLEGGEGADSLDGGVGEDTLYGGAGDDTLTGGDGVDELNGGAGFDTYYAESGNGLTIVRDSDGQGRIVLSGSIVTGGGRDSGSAFRSVDGTLSFAFVGDLAASGTLTIGDDVVVENFHNGDLGISLDGEAPTELPPSEFEYSWFTVPDNVAFDPGDAAAPYMFYGSYANDVFRYGLYDPAKSLDEQGPRLGEPLDGEPYRGWGGDDQYHGAYHYRDVFFGDGGDDAIFGGELGADYVPYEGADDSDELYGGGGRDTIVGGKGDDALCGDFSRVQISRSVLADFTYAEYVRLDTWSAVLGADGDVHAESRTPGESQVSIAFDGGIGFVTVLRHQLGLGDAQAPGDFYDDDVSGGSGDDRIFGGYGSDTLLGGDGDDFIDGDSPGFTEANLPPELLALLGRPGDDYLDGGDGNDYLQDQRGGSDTFLGGAGDDQLSNSDSFSGDEDAAPGSFSNYFDGGDGDDTITSYNNSIKGFDQAFGGAGNDTITVSSDPRFGGGNVFVSGGDGDDQIGVGSLNGHVDGGAGDDEIYIEGLEDDLEDDEMSGYDGVAVFGGAGNDTISTYGRIDVDGGDGDDSIEWAAAERQTKAGTINGGEGDDHIAVTGPAIIDAGAGDDEIVFLEGLSYAMSGDGYVTPGAGRDLIVINATYGASRNILLDLTGAGNADALVFKRLSGDGSATMPGQPDLLMQRAGDDLQLELVRHIGDAEVATDARVLIPDWFAADANQLASVTVEGLDAWTPADIAALVVVAPPEVPAVPPPGDGVASTPEVPVVPATEAATTSVAPASPVAAQDMRAFDFLANTPPTTPVANRPDATPRAADAALALPVDGINAAANRDQGDPGNNSDAVEAFLARLGARRDYDFSFAAGVAEGARQRVAEEFAPRVTPAHFAGQWTALHAYMDALAASPDTAQRIATLPEPAPVLGAIFSAGAPGFVQPGIAEASRIGISDSSLAGLRPLQGLSEGMAQLG
jgi:Ca2+-binding RTX toxin-like protein